MEDAAEASKMRDMPPHLVTSPITLSSHAKRIIFVGDVHGCSASLHKLLAKIRFNHDNGDHLVLTGDLTNKGPDSSGVVQLAMDVKASAVRGNHDDAVLRLLDQVQKEDGQEMGHTADQMMDTCRISERPSKDEPCMTAQASESSPESASQSHDDSQLRKTARSLTYGQIAWLKGLPLILRFPSLAGASRPPWNAAFLVVVHAGLVPHVPLERQEAWALTHMRHLVRPGAQARTRLDGGHEARSTGSTGSPTAEESTRARMGALPLDQDDAKDGREVLVPTRDWTGQPWSEVWNRLQNSIEKEEDRILVLYGHDAKAGLQVDVHVRLRAPKVENEQESRRGVRYAFGLDSGCVYGKQLTALILEAGVDGIVHHIEQVECEDVVDSKIGRIAEPDTKTNE